MALWSMQKLVAWSVLLLLGPAAQASVSSAGPPPPNCGLLCEPKASLVVAVSPLYASSLLENHPFALVYTITNKSTFTLQGFTTVELNGALLQNIYPDAPITLEPGQVSGGAVWVNNAPAAFGFKK